MKLAFYHNHPSGGASRAMYELGRRLARRHTIDVYTLATGDEAFLDSRDYARSVHAAPYEQRRALRLALYLNDWRRYLDLRDLDKVSRRVADEIDGAGYDAVLVNPCRFVQAPSVLRYLRTPSVYYCHEPPRRFTQPECRTDAGPLSRYQRARSLWHRPAQALLDSRLAAADRRNVTAAERVLTNSRFTAGQMERYYGRPADVCYLGVDIDRFAPGARSGSYVLSVGALEHHKGFDFLVRGLAALPAATRPPLLLVANYANPGVRADVLRLAAAKDVDIEIRERLSDQELVRAYQGAGLFLYAPRGEPFGLAVLEAMACGVPVVAVAEGGVTESVVPGETGVLAPRDERQFAQAVAKLLSDAPLREAMGEEGRRQADEKWSWDRAAERLDSALERARAGQPQEVRA